MKPCLIYLAGAYRAATPWLVEHNVRTAEAMILPLARMGAVPVCVHSMYRYFDKAEGLSTDYWIEATLEIMRRCDAVFVLRGVESKNSEGTKGEIAEAVRLGLPIFTDVSLLEAWLISRKEIKVLR